MAKQVSIGIDLGTSNSCVGSYDGKQVTIFPDVARCDKLIPSVVAFTDDGILVGHMAKTYLSFSPGSVVYDAKRLIEASFKDAMDMKEDSKWPFQVFSRYVLRNSQGFPYVKIGVKVGNNTEEYHPEEISAHVIKKLKTNAEQYLGDAVSKVVIAVTANFSTSMKEATRNAALIAGFQQDNVFIVHEPTAAAFACGAHLKGNNRRVLVYDLGGGTFDVTVLTIHNNTFSVEGTSGRHRNGGQDFTNNIVQEVVDTLKLRHQVELNSSQLQRLTRDCEGAKVDLTAVQSTTIVVEGVLPDRSNFIFQLKRDLFEQMNQGLFDDTLDIVKELLEDVGVKPADVSDLLLVGGSSRIPRIKAMLHEAFPEACFLGTNPDETVCEGAAKLAYAFANGEDDLSTNVLLDVASNNFGIEIKGDVVSPIIPWNAKLPHTVTKPYYNSKANQREIPINVYEGRLSEVKDNRLVGKFIVDGLPEISRKGEIEILVRFHLNNEGMLSVKASVGDNSVKRSLQIEKKLSPAVIHNMIQKADRQAKGNWARMVYDVEGDEPVEEPNQDEVVASTNDE